MEKPWKTASREEIESWIREAALCLLTTQNYDDWRTVRAQEQWTEDDAHEFIILHEREIRAARTHLRAWLAVQD